MNSAFEVMPIAHIRSDFPDKFGIPRQSGLVAQLQAEIVFEPTYRNADALRGLDEYSHLWLIWLFSKAVRKTWSPKVRPPRLVGNTRMGVFATRSPFRPNPLGLSCVKIEGIDLNTPEGPVIRVSGADLLDGTPIFDIKPYLPHIDAHPDALSGFAGAYVFYGLTVHCPDALLTQVPEAKREGLLGVLRQDPRPSYQDDPERVYGMRFAGFEVRFTVSGQELTVHELFRET